MSPEIDDKLLIGLVRADGHRHSPAMSAPSEVQKDVVVSFHYTLKDGEGETLDSSDGGDAMSYLHGADNIVPGLENELTGKVVGDKLNVVVEPKDGYGERKGPPPQKVPLTAFAISSTTGSSSADCW